MGYTVLYIAFGIVALWLLGEVLLQYKAPLQWRVVAFAGFIGVVIGVAAREVVVIGLGTVAFALGQTFVTISYRSGYSEGWSLNGPLAGQREGEGPRKPALRVTEIEPEPVSVAASSQPARGLADTGGMPLYHPQAMRDETGEYAAYGRQPEQQQPSYAADPYAGQAQAGDGYSGYDGYSAYGAAGLDQTTAMPGYQGQGGYQDQGYGYQDPAAYQGQGAYQDPLYSDQGYQQPGYQDQGGYQQPVSQAQDYQGAGGYPAQGYQDPYGQQAYDGQARGDEQQAAYLDPVRDSGQSQQAAYLDPQQYQQPYQDPYADPYGTPPGGVWAPQQQDQQNGGQQYTPPPAADPSTGYDPYRF